MLISLGLVIVSLRYVTDFWLLAFFFSLQPQLAVAAALGALASLVLHRSRFGYGLLALSLLLCAHAFWMKREFLPSPDASPAADATPIRLLSFNMLGDNDANARRIADMVKTSGADVAYLLEAGPIEPYLAELSAIYPYRIGCGIAVEACDLLMLSKHPMTNPQFVSLSDLRQNRFAVATIRIGGQPVEFAAIHVTKPYFDDYHTMELRRASRILKERGGNLVIGGDFNSDTIAPDMQHFLRRGNLRTAGVEPATWPVEAGIFGIPIDHIYMSKTIIPTALERIGDSYGSNHYGLIADLAIAPAR